MIKSVENSTKWRIFLKTNTIFAIFNFMSQYLISTLFNNFNRNNIGWIIKRGGYWFSLNLFSLTWYIMILKSNFLLTLRFMYNCRSESKCIKYVNLKRHSLSMRKNFSSMNVRSSTRIQSEKVFRAFSAFDEDFSRVVFRNWSVLNILT